MGGRGEVDYRNPCCLTMHQPWASLLVHGIKRIEGRSWPAPLRGRLWIHAAGKVPDSETIKAMEDFYREIYRVNGIEDLKFPEHYPVSQLLGSVDVVGCVKCEELVSWEEVPEGVRLEGQTTLCWLCENPQKLLTPFEMRGNQGVYNLERRIHEQAVRSLYPVKGPLPVKFPLPDSRNPFSLKPGSLVSHFGGLKVSEAEKPPSLTAAIAGARAAATQFSRQQKYPTSSLRQRDTSTSRESSQSKNKSTEECARPVAVLDGRPQSHNGNLINNYREQNVQLVCERNSSSRTQRPHRGLNHQSGNRWTEEYGRPVAVLDRPNKNGHSPHNHRDRSNEMGRKGNSTSHTIREDLDHHPGPPGAAKIFVAAMKGLWPT